MMGKGKFMLGKTSVLLSVLMFSIGLNAAPEWPDEQQIALVQKRLQTFPWQTIVSDVDWYSPLETVSGSPSKPLAVIPNNPDEYQAAAELAAQHNSYALLIWRDGALRYEHYWPGFDEQSRFDTASMHKTVVALLTGAAVADGFIQNINQKLGDFLPDVQPEALRNAPLRSLLEMSSGMASPPFGNSPDSVSMQSYLGNDLKAAYSKWPMAYAINEKFHYANVNPQYLGWVIEQATGMRYADYLSQRLWQPLGAGEARVWLDRDGGTPRTSCCLQASARDWLRVGLLILNEGKVGNEQVVPASWIQDMLSPSSLNPNYGWLIWRGSPHNPNRKYSEDSPFSVPAVAPFNADDVYYLDGSGAQRVYIVPSQNTVIVRIGQPSKTWDDSQLPNLILH